MKTFIRFIGMVLSVLIFMSLMPCLEYDVKASYDANISLTLCPNSEFLPSGMIATVSAQIADAPSESQLQFYEMGKHIVSFSESDTNISYKTVVKPGTKSVYARLVDKSGNVVAESDELLIKGLNEKITDVMWDIDFEKEYFNPNSDAPEWRYLYGADDKLMTVTRGGATSTLRANTGDTYNDMTIEDTGDELHGKAIKITTVTDKQNQFNEFRARNAGGIIVGEWDCRFTSIPEKRTGMAVKIMEPNLAKNGAGNGVGGMPYIAVLYKNSKAYIGWTDGTDNDVKDVYVKEIKEDVWYNVKTYTDFNTGTVVYCVDDVCIAISDFNPDVYVWTEKYRISFYNASGFEAWVDNFKVYGAKYIPFKGIGGVEYKINNEATTEITDGNLMVTAYLSNDGTARECICYVALYDKKNVLVSLKGIPVSFAEGETSVTTDVDVGAVSTDMKVKTFLWLKDSVRPFSEVSSLVEYTPDEIPETYWKVDFENGSILSAMFGAKNNVLEQGVEPNGNNCIIFKRATSNDFHLDMYVAPYPSDTIVYQHDVKLVSWDVTYTSYLMSSSSNALLYSVDSGVLKVGDKSYRLSLGNRHTISSVYKVNEGTIDVYIDYTLLCAGIKVPDAYSHKDAKKWRIHVNRTNGDDMFYVDNIAVYNSAVPLKLGGGFVISDDITLYESDDVHEEFLSDKVSYHTRSGVICVNGQKSIVKPLKTEDVIFVPLSFFEKSFGMEVSYDEIAGEAKIGSFKLTSGNVCVKTNNKEITLSDAPEIIEGEFAVPLTSFTEKCLNKYVLYDNKTISGGFVIISDYNSELSSVTDVQKLNDFLLYLRPSKEKIATDFENSGKSGVHPRIMADESDFNRIRSLVKTDGSMKFWADKIIDKADELCKDNTPLIYELRDGVRLLYVSYDMIDHMFTLGMAYQLTGDKKYAERAWTDLESVANFPDWHPKHALDVGAMACGYSVGYDWMYDEFTPEQRAVIEKGAYNCGISAYVEGYQNRNTHMVNGITMANNWAMVMNGGATMLGSAFFDVYPEYSAYMIASSIRCIEFSIYKYAPDGGWFEGMGYAGMALEYLTYQLSCLKSIFKTVYTIDATEGLDSVPEFYLYMQSPQGCFGYKDGASQNVHFDAGMLWMGDHYEDYGTLNAFNGLFGFGVDVRTLLWYNPDKLSGSTELTLDKFYEGQQVLTMRDSWNKKEHSVFAGIKGYVSDLGHGHMDHGTFVFYSNGTRWTHDFGSENYNVPGYWQGASYDSARWQYYRVRGEGHNTLIINPDQYAEFDPTKNADFVRYESNENGVIGIIDTTQANMGKAKSVQRGIYFADNRQSLVIRDEIITNGESTMYWSLHTEQNAKLTPDGKGVVLTDKNNSQNYVNLDLVCNADYELSIGPAIGLETSPHPEDMTDDSATTVIRLKVVSGKNVNITAKLTPYSVKNPRDISEFDIPMSNWKIPE